VIGRELRSRRWADRGVAAGRRVLVERTDVRASAAGRNEVALSNQVGDLLERPIVLALRLSDADLELVGDTLSLSAFDVAERQVSVGAPGGRVWRAGLWRPGLLDGVEKDAAKLVPRQLLTVPAQHGAERMSAEVGSIVEMGQGIPNVTGKGVDALDHELPPSRRPRRPGTGVI
jgi:hypothetical protein